MLKKISILLLLLFNLNISFSEENLLPYPYDTVKVLPFNSFGFFGNRQADFLQHIIKQNNIKTVVEIGSFLGSSTCFIAKQLPSDGKIYAIDHWEGNSEWENKDFFREQPLFYQQFLSNVIHENLCEKIIPMKMSSIEASSVLEVEPDLIFIDGSHDFESVYEDICAWYPFVKEKGVLILF